MPETNIVRATEAAFGRCVPPTGIPEGEPNRRGTLDARSRAHDDLDTAKVRGVGGDWVHQRKERDSSGACVRRTEAQLCRTAFLARGYFVSTVGRDETLIREYIRNQEKEDERLDQMKLDS